MSAINKIVFGTKVLLDLTSDTVTADTLVEGVTAHDKTGAIITGRYRSETSEDLTNFIEGNMSGHYPIPVGITQIGTARFYGFSGLSSVSIPSTVRAISELAFANMGACTYYFTSCNRIPTLASANAFSNTAGEIINIVVPTELYEQWIQAPEWSKLAAYITCPYPVATPKARVVHSETTGNILSLDNTNPQTTSYTIIVDGEEIGSIDVNDTTYDV